MTIRIVTDSACDLPQQLADEHGITIVPLTFSFGDEEFVDRASLTPAEFWARCSASPVLPQTAAPAPGKFAAAFSKLASGGATGILVVTISAELSATLQAAEQGAKDAGVSIPIRFVDSRSASMGEGINVLAAARLAASASNIDDLAAQVRSLAERTRVWGALDTLENLKKNGRIGGAKALLASALAIKPIITVKDGKVAEGGKQRTRSKALEFVIEQFRNDGAVSNVAVLHAECSDVDAFVARLRETYKGEIVVGNIGSVIGSHTGPGTIGVTYHTA
ncbi:MAG: DegV family protein [Actinobacteria bacterium]|nr:DegV family protein [Actinomycetota bacterium]NBO80119.1 DegV family protein [Actinomycetota bacterium]NDC46030.1 DegV family protein [Actinomycetota bacterium]NDE66634.1 DegV family protein [Actinomycetota bacterium]